ncbi:NRPS-like enzyme [Penicillium malachiteum]|uniref:NRPS-like enzyme n=1 Tax=Penicillium malachiteum TaxID=1324776 RepID=UPI00254901DB|nr:NRPS-like enzyme [Penicillium malachiteum]KAJ5714679.1 NRPS-like enzyme [Penicillium malachiteum]
MGSIGTDDRLATHIVDAIAQAWPDTLYCIQPESNGEAIVWHKITYSAFANAVNRISWWIDGNLHGKPNGQVLAYIGANDLRYSVFMLACMKTGHQALLLSTRNSQAASRHLFQETKCSIIVDGTEKLRTQQMVDELVTGCADIPLQRWFIASIWDIFSPELEKAKHYPHQRSFDDLEDTPTIIIHSSGTTGNPKPVIISHGYLATFDRLRVLPVPPGRQNTCFSLRANGQLRFMYGPMFHWVGVVCTFESIFYQTPFLIPPDKPLTQSLFTQIMETDHPPVWALVTPPIMEDMCTSEEGQRALSKLKVLTYGGAPMAHATGEKVASLLRLQTIFGSSETAYTPSLLCEDPADWDYLEWNPSFEHKMEDAGDRLWELVLPRPASRYHHAIFYSQPNLQEYRTGDLFLPHPSKPNLWHYEGRRDDIIVLSNGEKFNPTQAEKQIQTHHLVKHAAIFGQTRFQSALLIEPEWDDLEDNWSPAQLVRQLQTVLSEANELLPAYGKIFDSHIAFASRDKPFDLSPKGSLRRRTIANDYSDAINQLYEPKLEDIPTPDKEMSAGHHEELTGSSMDEIQRWIQHEVTVLLRLETVGLDDDLFNIGMDSLQAIRLTQILRKGLESQRDSEPGPHDPWTDSAIYDLPTIRKLADKLGQQINGDRISGTNAESIGWPREDRLARTIWEHSLFLGSKGLTIALTGSTGELGSYLLNSLLKDPSIEHIYCLNRSEDAKSRQASSFRAKGLPDVWITQTSRIQFWRAKFDQENLGLTSPQYRLLQENVDIIIHNAWPVNFNRTLESFEPQLIGVTNLLRLVEESTRAEFHFVSSVAAATGNIPENMLNSRHKFSETRPYLGSEVMPYGYAESKFVAEALCELSCKRSGTRITIYRVGQLGGPSTMTGGMWNPRDWFPSLVRSSQTMKIVPDSLGLLPVNWLPIDTAARAMTEMIGIRFEQKRTERRDFINYEICNPRTTNWTKLAPVVAKACDAKVVSLGEWVKTLESQVADSIADAETFNNLPALPLLSFFQLLATSRDQHPTDSSSYSSTISNTLNMMAEVDAHWMELWLKQLKTWIPDLVI